jgi:hypothetical protein
MQMHEGTPGANRRAPEPTGDPLPGAARAKLLTLQGTANDARDASASAQARLRGLQDQLSSSTLSDEQQDGIEREIDRLIAVRTKQNERHAALLAVVDGIRRYLQALPRGITLEMVRHPTPKLLKGENNSAALSRIRNEIADLKQQRQAVASASLPKSVMKAAAKRYVEEMAARGRPRVAGDSDGFKATFGDTKTFAPQGVRAAAELLCWHDGPGVLARLEAEIDALPTPSLVLDTEERATRLAELTSDLERLERDEESLIEQAWDDGSEVLRRPEANPAAILGVRIKQRQRVRAD